MGHQYGFGPFRLDVRAETLYEGDRLVALPSRAIAVLALLADRRGQVVTKDELLAAAWPDSFVSEDSLTHAVSLLRSALGEDPRSPRYLQTVPRRGYRFVAEVVDLADRDPVAPAQTAAPEIADPSTIEPTLETAPRRVSATTLAAAAIGVVAVLTVAAAIRTRTDPTAAIADAGLRIERIGVQPFTVDPAEDAELRLFADAIAATFGDLLERETKITAVPLGVPGDASVPSAPTQATFSGEIRRDATANLLVVRVRDPQTGDAWWRQEWRLPVDEFAPADVARSMLTRLWPLLDSTSVFSTRPGSESKESTLLVVQAAELLFDTMQRDYHASLRAENILDRAVQLDPAYARARAALVAVMLESIGWRPPTAEEEAQMRQDEARALRDGPDDPVVQVAVALMALYEGDLTSAMSALDRAQRLAPDLLWPYLIRPDVELQLGQPQLALASVRLGLALDPYMLAVHGRLVDVLLYTGDLAGAALAGDRLAQLDPGGYWAGRARSRLLRLQGGDAAAELELLQLRERWADAPWVHQEIADFYRAAGRQDEALEAEQTLAAMARGEGQ